MKVKSLSRVGLLATPWTAAYQAPLSMGFARQEYWSGVPLSCLLLLLPAWKMYPQYPDERGIKTVAGWGHLFTKAATTGVRVNCLWWVKD